MAWDLPPPSADAVLGGMAVFSSGLMLLTNPSGCSCIHELGIIQKGYNSKTKPFCFRLLVKMLIIDKQQADSVPSPLAVLLLSS